MSTVPSWIVRSTAELLARPKFFIVLPILVVFLTAYSVVYDYTLRPINSSLAAYYSNSTLHDGSVLHSHPQHSIPRSDSWMLSRVSVAHDGATALRYDFLEQLHGLENKNATIISPFSAWALDLASIHPLREDKRKIEKSVLRTLNHGSLRLQSLFFAGLAKQNHMVQLAAIVHLYVAHSPLFDLQTLAAAGLPILEIRTSTAPTAVADFDHYFRQLRGDSVQLNTLMAVIHFSQFVAMILIVGRVYLCICNQHKIRSNIGLVIGWLTEVIVASSAALSILSWAKGLPTWEYIFEPVSFSAAGGFFLLIMLFSSRTLFRTINDLAGDNTFGALENLHRRLIRYYLGINSSVHNSQGVYAISKQVRRLLWLDALAAHFPCPNTTVILAINLAGISTLLFLGSGVCTLLTKGVLVSLYHNEFLNVFQACILALLIDHMLQLTFLVGIIVIDLNRVELADLLKNGEKEDGVHEVNPISAYLLGLKGTRPSTDSWRHLIGTHFLKVAPSLLTHFWTFTVLVFVACHFALLVLICRLVFPARLLNDVSGVISLDTETVSWQTYDWLYYLELGTIVVFIFAISEIIFTLTFSKRQRKEVGQETAMVPTTVTVKELAAADETKYFECITLKDAHRIDILKLACNSKSSFVVAIDLDHNVLVWSPLGNTDAPKPINISTHFAPEPNKPKREFWPVNQVEISNDSNYIIMINNKNAKIKCFERKSLDFIWEVSLPGELGCPGKRIVSVGAFFRKKTVAGFLARKLLQRKKASRMPKLSRRDSTTSMASTSTITGNFPPPQLLEIDESGNMKDKPFDESIHREEFVMVLETGEVITISCSDVKMKVQNVLKQLYSDVPESKDLKIVSLQLLTTSRVNDRIVCNLSNDDLVVGTAVNNLWRFMKLDLNAVLYNAPVAGFMPVPMSRASSMSSIKHNFTSAFEMEKQNSQKQELPPKVRSETPKKYSAINTPTIVTIDFVGMILRVKDLQAELIDTLTGMILKTFHVGVFKPGSFRVAHAEPTHCKFCGCASVESISLIYEDFYNKTVVVHTFTIESKKSRNSICLRVERDPREIRCVGFDSVLESQFWYEDVEKWEVTDMNVIIGVKKAYAKEEFEEVIKDKSSDYHSVFESGLTSLRSRSRLSLKQIEDDRTLSDMWQGFVILAQNGKVIEYSIPPDAGDDDFSCSRANAIAKYGYKAVAIAFGCKIKILYLGGDKLIESDLYYSGSIDSLEHVTNGVGNSNELLFINKRRQMQERKLNQGVR